MCKNKKENLKYISVTILIAVISCMLISLPVNAFVSEVRNSTSPHGMNDVTSDPVTSQDQFGRWDWNTLGDAQNYYGADFEYTKLNSPVYHNGHAYNYYYTFSDGSRMYFGIV